MIDTRNHYRAVPVRNKPYWRVEFRRWFSLLWHEIEWVDSLERAEVKAVDHAKGDNRETVHFGRLPA